MADVPLMNNPMTTAGDVIYGGASGAPTRLAVGTAGQVLKVNSGATAPEWGAASAAALDVTSAPCTADTAIPNTSTYTDVTGCSASLAAGTWMAIVTAQLSRGAAGWIFYNLQVTDGSTVYAVNRGTMPGNDITGQAYASFHSQPFTLGSTTTVKLQGASNNAFTVQRRAGTLNASNIDGTHVTFIPVT